MCMWFYRKSPKELVVTCMLDPNNVEKAEQICQMFGLDLQQLVEAAADRQLELGQLESAISLYKLARVCIILYFVKCVSSISYEAHIVYSNPVSYTHLDVYKRQGVY